MRLLLLALLVALALPATTGAQPSAPSDSAHLWQIDVSHSELSFRIRHFISRVRGTFGRWEGTITADTTRLGAGAVSVTIDASSIDTQHERRDADLRSANFFEVERYPTITFVSRQVTAKGKALTIVGDLTMRGITRPVTLTGEYVGSLTDRRGTRIGFQASTTINRLDWGLTWNRLAEGGGAMLGDDVEIELVVAGTRR